MRLETKLEQSLGKDFLKVGEAVRDAADAAVEATSEETKTKGRTEIGRGLSRRAANTFRIRFYQDAGKTVVGYVHSNWRKKKTDILAGFQSSITIRPTGGGALAVPLRASGTAWTTLSAGRFENKRVTPAIFERETGLKLHPFKARDGTMFLGVKRSDLEGTKKSRVRGVKRIRRGLRTRAPDGIVAVFVLTRQVKLPQKIDLAPVRTFAEHRLPEQFILKLGERGVDT